MSTPRSRLGVVAEPFEGNLRFELSRVLGEGGMGVVYEALDHERGMPVALKTVRDLDAQGLYRLKTEFRARADLEHRNLVRLGELFEDDGRWFFTMELVEGVSFLDWVRGAPEPSGDESSELPMTPRLHEARLRDALRQLALGLEALHRVGKVHRDLKPSNVLITRKGRVVILDFGLVGDTSARQPSDQSVIGTAAYMAPEQALAPVIAPAADVYSAGVMLFEALTGQLPFEGRPLEVLMRKQREAAPSPRTLADVPDDLATLCNDMLAIDPARRPTATAILARVSQRALPVDERPVPFVGRSAELAALDAALDEVAAGATRTVFVEGESGIGKSALVRAFVDRIEARRPDARVVAGRCYERESVPFKGIDGVVDALARDLMRRDPLDVALLLSPEVEALARLFPVLRRVPAIARLSVPSPASPLELRARAFRGLRQLLGTLSTKHTLVVVIDDVQWADTDSLALLRDVLHAPGAPWLLLLLTRRGDIGSRPVLPGAGRVIPLGRLSADEGRTLVSLLAPARTRDADALVDDAGGHPMFLQELARHTGNRAIRFDEALWTRVTRMEEHARRVLELVAVAGAPVAQAVVGAALGLDARALSKAVDILRGTSMVRTRGTRGSDPVEPYHDRVREAVLARVPATRRRRYHGKLAAAMLGSDAVTKDPLVVVRHLEAAGFPDRAAELAEQAARRALDALAFELAAELLSTALRLGRHGVDGRRDLLVGRAEALGYAGRGAEAAEVYLAAADGADPETAFQCRRLAAHELLVSGRVPEGLRLLDQVLAAIGEARPRSVRRAKGVLAWRWLLTLLRGTRFRVRHTLDARPIDHLRLDLYRGASLGLGMVDLLPGAIFQARSVLVALRVGDVRRVAYALAYHAMYLGSSGIRVPWARRLVARARALAESTRSEFLLGWSRAAEGIVEFFGGNYDAALALLGEAEEVLRERSMGTAAELNHLRVFITFALRRTGDYKTLRDKQTLYLRDALRRGDRYAAAAFQWASNVVWVAAGDVEHARADLAPEAWSPPEQGLHLQHWFRQRARLELALYEDDRAAMPGLGRDLAPFLGPGFAHVEAVYTETRCLLGRIAIVAGDAAGARRAVRQLRRVRVPYVRGYVRVVLAAAAVLDGKRDEARALLAGAIADAELCGMATLAALARRRAGQLAGGDAGTRAVADADEVLRRRGIADPARFAQIFATWPG